VSPPSFFEKIRGGLARTRNAVVERIAAVVGSGGLDQDAIEEIEAILLQADVGVETAAAVVDALEERGADGPQESGVFELLRAELTAVVAADAPLDIAADLPASPHVVLVVGVNGVGKTTTIGKLAQQHRDRGRQVLLAACDTFRAGAVAQLEVWAERTGSDIVRAQQGADPAAVAYDAAAAATSRGVDVVIVDTAGRLHTKINLMEELKKVRRTLGKQDESAPHETLLVVDATTGQNALTQARQFHEAIGVTGLVLTNLDGTAKGGIAFALRRELGLPIRYVGVGEGVDDLQPFDGSSFVEALLDR
jgi:fused signal recognition particle receptor